MTAFIVENGGKRYLVNPSIREVETEDQAGFAELDEFGRIIAWALSVPKSDPKWKERLEQWKQGAVNNLDDGIDGLLINSGISK